MSVLSEHTRLDALTDDAYAAIASNHSGPADITDYAVLTERLSETPNGLPFIYDDMVRNPFQKRLKQIGARGWSALVASDPHVVRLALQGFDISQAIIQRSDGTYGDATHALQEVVSDLFDGFLSAADRGGIKRPDHAVIPPLVKWGRPEFGPYTWPVTSLSSFGCRAGVVNMPPAFADRGLAAWAAMSHESAGHQILHADEGLREDLAETVRIAFDAEHAGRLGGRAVCDMLKDYWAERIDETASDLMGVVNMGPAAIIGLIAYFRALQAAWRGRPQLSTVGLESSEHPLQLGRGYLMAYGIGVCGHERNGRRDGFDSAENWRDALIVEVDRDAPPGNGHVTIGDTEVSVAVLKRSAELVANAILTTPTNALDNAALIDIQNWRQRDEEVVQALVTHTFLGPVDVPRGSFDSIYAAHVVSAATITALLTGDPVSAQQRMVQIAADMHGLNMTWVASTALHPDGPSPHLAHEGLLRRRKRREADDDDADTLPPLPGTGGPEVPMLVPLPKTAYTGGAPVPMFVPSAGRPGATDASAFMLARAGLSVDGENGAWHLLNQHAPNSPIDASLSNEALALLLGRPGWISRAA